MKYYNISKPSEKVTLKQAVTRSVINIQDLYMPEEIPEMPVEFFRSLDRLTLPEIAFMVSRTMLHDDLPDEVIERISYDSFTFDIPLRKLTDNVFALELFHGPTMAFKDIGARFMAGLVEYFMKTEKKEITILVATSGDTGSAVANAFYNREGVKVNILYPSGRVSNIQEKQLTTMGGNIKAYEVDGDFDDCQRLVKMAFADWEINDRLTVTSANSINFARLFPQSIYYFNAIARMPERTDPVVFSVPSGNFGNLTAGLIAWKMGLPVRKFIAATNINHSVPEYLESGSFNPKPTQSTITNAMDVGNPNNFPRILSLFGNNYKDIRNILAGCWFTDGDTRQAMRELKVNYGYDCDPHGAIWYLGVRDSQRVYACSGIFLETAHPVKFKDEVESATGSKIKIPDEINKLLKLEKESKKISNDYNDFRSTLLKGS